MPDSFRPTPEQERAISQESGLICIEAGAGTGKTSVIVERYLHLLGNVGLSPTQILAITFTRKAAQEMKHRILAALDQAGLGEMRRHVEAGYIHTFHGFCERLLRENPFDAGVDPEFELFNEQEARRHIEVAFREACAAIGDEEAHVRGLLSMCWRTVERGEDGRFLGSLRREVDALLDRIRSYGLSRDELVEWWQQAAASAPCAYDTAIRLAGAPLLRLAAKTLQVSQAPQLSTLERLAAFTEQPTPEQVKDFVREALSLRPKDLAPSQWSVVTELQQQAKKLRSFLETSNPEIEEAAARAAVGVLRLCLETWDRYAAIKRAKGALDFQDLESLALGVLEGCEPVREKYRARFRQVLVDEFQDVNPLQACLVRALATIETVCFVGDPRQAIYGFRHADVEQFRHWAGEAAERASSEPDRSSYVELTSSFRSRPSVLAFVSELMKKCNSEDFGSLSTVRPQAPDPASSVEVWHGGSNMPDAEVVARGIRRLVASRERSVGDVPREVRYGDIALLFRQTARIDVYRDAMLSLGVPAVIVRAGRHFYTRYEVRDVRNALRSVARPDDDFAMACLLRSPMVGLSMDALTLLCVNREGTPVYEVLRAKYAELPEEDREKATAFLAWFEPLARLYDRYTVAELLERLLMVTDYRPKLLSRGDGKRQLANIRKLQELAFGCKEEDLSSFVTRLDRLRQLGAQEGDAPLHDEEANAVAIMTMHGAKGLEFPVVVIAEAGRLSRGHPNCVIVEPKERLVASNFREEPPLLFRVLDDRRKKREEAEEWRLLYVAMTRARDKLVLSMGHHRGQPSWQQSQLRRALGLNAPKIRTGPRNMSGNAQFTVVDVSEDA